MCPFLKVIVLFYPLAAHPEYDFCLLKLPLFFQRFSFTLYCAALHMSTTTIQPACQFFFCQFSDSLLFLCRPCRLFQSTIANFFDKLTIHNRPQVRVNKDSSHLNYPRTENISSSLTIKWNEDPIFVVVRVTKYRKYRLLYPCRGDRS